jgi:hypothetical protein
MLKRSAVQGLAQNHVHLTQAASANLPVGLRGQRGLRAETKGTRSNVGGARWVGTLNVRDVALCYDAWSISRCVAWPKQLADRPTRTRRCRWATRRRSRGTLHRRQSNRFVVDGRPLCLTRSSGPDPRSLPSQPRSREQRVSRFPHHSTGSHDGAAQLKVAAAQSIEIDLLVLCPGSIEKLYALPANLRDSSMCRGRNGSTLS